MTRPAFSALLAAAAWLAAAPLWAQEAPASAAASAPAAAGPEVAEEPPFPPPAIEGEAPTPPPEEAPAEAAAEPDAATPGAEEAPAPAARPAPDPQRPAARPTPPWVRPPPGAPQPPPPPVVPERVLHGRGLAVMTAQIPLALVWGAAAGSASYLASALLLSAPNMAAMPYGAALIAAPMLTALAGAGVSVVANVVVLPMADALFDAPEVADGTLGETALWSALYAGIIAAVMGIPLTLPPLFAASGLSDDADISTMLAYALVASFVPVAVAPMAALEAANDGGYRADLPVWCWHAMRICSLGTVVIW